MSFHLHLHVSHFSLIIGIGGQVGLKLTYGIRVHGTTFKARRVDKVIFSIG